MPGPLPGMDPYLEDKAIWPDVHQRLITYLSDTMQPQLRPHYNARIGERVYLVEPPRSIYPDISIVRPPRRNLEDEGGVATLVEPDPADVDEPWHFKPLAREHREPFIEIHHRGGEVVTVIEVLSPANKQAGDGRDLYLQKQQEILQSRTHLIEIDLLSTGLPTLALEGAREEDLPHWRYLVCTHRNPQVGVEVYPISLSQRLPRFRVPLRHRDPDIIVPLQDVLARCYDNGGYADIVDYQRSTVAPLTPEERFWMETVLHEKGALQSR